MTVDDLKSAWNAQPDQYNQWDELGLDEIVHFSQQQEREACAKVCDIPPGTDVNDVYGGNEGMELCNSLATAIRART